MYLLSMCRRVFFGPRIPALATVGDMRPRELTIALVLVVPTLMIGFWPRLATGIYDATTDSIAGQLHNTLLAALQLTSSFG
jgi:NAD(P)H-quinone oxidoreductase subunit 4